MYAAKIDAGACDGSTACPVRRVCPRGAVVRFESGQYAGTWAVDGSRCTGCGMCVRVCPARAVTMVER